MDGFAACGSQAGETLWASLAHIGAEITGSSDPRAGRYSATKPRFCLPRFTRPETTPRDLSLCSCVWRIFLAFFSSLPLFLEQRKGHKRGRGLPFCEHRKDNTLLLWFQHLHAHHSDHFTINRRCFRSCVQSSTGDGLICHVSGHRMAILCFNLWRWVSKF